MAPKISRRVFSDIPDTESTKQIADVIEFAASQVHRGQVLRQFLVRKLHTI